MEHNIVKYLTFSNESKQNDMSVKLRKRKNQDGTVTLRLDIYNNRQRYFETLKNLKLEKVNNAAARERNKELLQQAESIRVARAAELDANNYSLVSDAGKKTIVIVWLQSFADGYEKKDKRNMQGAVKRFGAYLQSIGKSKITFSALDAALLDGFTDRLNNECKGEGASSYHARFKKAIKQAYRKRLLRENPFDFTDKKPKGKAEKKDILTTDELRMLAATSCQNSEIKRAALFSAMTGLRWIDVKGLQWDNINMTEKKLSIRQSKTGEEVTVELNDSAVKLLGEYGSGKVFTLPSADGANKTLKALVKRAGITKKITWHNLRHSFGTNLIYNDVDVLTASKLLGHTSLRHTQRYVNAADEMKRTATNKIDIGL